MEIKDPMSDPLLHSKVEPEIPLRRITKVALSSI
jgi:hypothetical protein